MGNQGHEGHEEEGSHEARGHEGSSANQGNEGHEEEGSHEACRHEGSSSNQGNEGHEEESSHESHEGYEGHESYEEVNGVPTFLLSVCHTHERRTHRHYHTCMILLTNDAPLPK